jgi:phosphoglycolate phosphatase-like HAD superfamily hydrolase
VAGFFQALVCAEDTAERKPRPEPLLLALERMRLAPGQAVYIGDSPEDVEMARAAGVRAVGIPGAFPNREALAAARPDVLSPSLAEAVARVLAVEPGP